MKESSNGLQWQDVCYSVPVGRKQHKWILCNASGEARPGRVLAILGPSGSGKTTLLKILAQRLERVKGARLGGQVFRPQEPAGSVAYVAQETGFFSCLTVRETLDFTARMQGAGEDASAEVVARLGLGACADTLVGGDSGGVNVAGVSGGEKRRLAIGCEVLGEVAGCIIADEPTTGLDAFQAGKTMNKLADMAAQQRTAVICSLHVPRSSIFDRLDDVMLLSAGGRVCYMGPAHEALAYFRALGFECPTHHNPAEFLVDLISVDSSPEVQAEDERRVLLLQQAWERRVFKFTHDLQDAQAPRPGRHPAPGAEAGRQVDASEALRPGPLRQFLMLARRAWRQNARDAYVNLSRAAAAAVIGLALGTVNYKLGRGQKSVQSRASLLVQMCINTSMMATIKSLNGFSRERHVVLGEMARSGTHKTGVSASGKEGRRGYGVGPYFLAKFCVDTPLDAIYAMIFAGIVIPMAGLNPKSRLALIGTTALQATSASTIGLAVSALTPSSDTALAVGPVMMIFSLMLADTGGMFAPVPDFLKPLSHLSCIKWGFEGCLAAEFRGLEFDQDVDNLMDAIPSSGNKDSQETGATGAAAAVRSVLQLFSGEASMNKARRQAMERMCAKTGEDVLGKLGMADQTVAGAAKAQLGVIAANVLMTYVALRAQGKGIGSNLQLFDSKLKAPSIL